MELSKLSFVIIFLIRIKCQLIKECLKNNIVKCE